MQRPDQPDWHVAAQGRRVRAGHAASIVRGGSNQLTAGGGFDRSRTGFLQSTELGYLNPDRSVTGMNAFGDGETGGDVDGEPFDTRVDLDGLIHTYSLYATDTLSFAEQLACHDVGTLQPHDHSPIGTPSIPVVVRGLSTATTLRALQSRGRRHVQSDLAR